MNPSNLSRIEVTPRLVRQFIIGFLVVVVLAVVLNFFLTKGRLVIDVEGKGNDQIIVYVSGGPKGNTKEVKFSQSGQKTLWLSKGEYTTTLSQGYRNTIGVGRAEIFKKSTVKLVAKDEAASKRIAGQSMGCGTIANDVYFSYNCLVPGKIFQETAQGRQEISGDSYDLVTPLDNGFLTAIFRQGFADYYYLEPSTGKKVAIIPAAQLKNYDPNNITLVTNTESNATYKFALVMQPTNTWYLYKDIADKNPIELKPGQADKGFLSAASQLTGDRLVTIYRPTPSDEHTEEGQATDDKNKINKITSYSAISRKTELSVTLPDTLGAVSLQFISADYAAAEITDGGVSILKVEGDKFRNLGIISGAGNLEVGNGRAFFSHNSSVYELHPDSVTANRLFEAGGFRFSALNLLGDKIIMQAYTGQQSQDQSGLPSAFLLDLTQPATYPREEWKLPRVTSNNERIGTNYSSGIDNLIAQGVSEFQIDSLKYALTLFAESKHIELKNVSLNSIEIVPRDRDVVARDEARFTVVINSKDTYKASMQYFDLSAIRLRLMDSNTQAQIFDSQDVDLTQ